MKNRARHDDEFMREIVAEYARMEQEKIVAAEVLSEGHTKLRITLASGEIIEGYSLGIMPQVDDEGEELDEDCLAFDACTPVAFYKLREEDIQKVERATHEGE